ncbi:hypothetical protein [Lentzea aerocolonigenes]|uniref:hypothetical protein n=1 Tax=Lentzea aerocolonigenes TaxID=68170 RepID=UPI0004C33910|nr:hypothetical protein [Lentzea aerocolonigenes]
MLARFAYLAVSHAFTALWLSRMTDHQDPPRRTAEPPNRRTAEPPNRTLIWNQTRLRHAPREYERH